MSTVTQDYRVYYQDAMRYHLPKADQQRLLAEYKRTGDMDVRSMFLQSQICWVAALMRNAFGYCRCLLDLIQQANLDLAHLLETYDPDNEAGAGFHSYSGPILLHLGWINAPRYTDGLQVSTAFRKRAGTVRRIYREQIESGAPAERALTETTRQYYAKFHRRRYDDLCALDRRRAEEAVRGLLQLGALPVSLDAPIGEDEDGGYTLGSMLGDESLNPETLCVDLEETSLLREAILRLPPKQRFVVVHYYGVFGAEKMNYTQRSRCMGVTRQRVAAISTEALLTLRTLMCTDVPLSARPQNLRR